MLIDQEFIAIGAGALGAAMYGVPRYLASSPGDRPLLTFATALMLGTATSPIFAPIVGKMVAFLYDPSPYPAFFLVGLLVNPLAPAVVKKGEEIIANLPASFKIGSK